MQYRIDERSGNKLSVLGFGCMRFSRNISGIDLKKSEALIMRAIEAGVNYFDTAYIYPGSETALGTALAKNNVRDKVFIATKLPIYSCNATADFDKFLSAQLTALSTTYLDYYLMHNLSTLDHWNKLCDLGIKDWIRKKKAEGKIKQIGFSFHGVKDEFEKLLNAYDWDFCQIQYNYANETYQAGVSGLKMAADKHMPIIIMEPLLGGRLATGLSPAALTEFQKVIPDRSSAAWAMRWLWNQPEVTVVLSGMNALPQLEDNLKSASDATPGVLTEEEKQAYSKVLEIFRSTDKIPCTGCSYCMPCPAGVNIPGCFASYNASYSHGRIAGFTMYITSTASNRKDNMAASKCIQCGKCERHCPQNIKIRDSMEAVTKRMEPFYFNWAMGFMRRSK